MYRQPGLHLGDWTECNCIQALKSKISTLLPLPYSGKCLDFRLSWSCICSVFVQWMDLTMLSYHACINCLVGIQVELWLRTNYWFLGAHLSSKRVETEGLNCHSESSSLYLLFGSTLWLLEVVLRTVFPLTLLIAPDLCPLFAIMWRIRTSASKYSPKSNDNSDVNFEQQYLFICSWIGWSLKWQHIHCDIKSHLFLSFWGERFKTIV